VATATGNVAPCNESSGSLQSHGTSVSAPSAIDATNPIEAHDASSRSAAVEHCGTDMLHQPGSHQGSSLPTPPDYVKILSEAQTANELHVVEQLANGTLDDKTFDKIQRFAHQRNRTVESVVETLLADPAFASFFAADANKQYVHERAAFEYINGLKLHPDSPVDDARRLPARGPNSMHMTTHGVFHQDELGRMKTRASSLDINVAVAGWTAFQSHKFTFGEGGSQDNAYANMIEFAWAARRMRSDVAALHRSMDQFGRYRPAIFIAVVDGPYWNKERRTALAKAGRAVSTPEQGGFMVCTTAELAGIYAAIAELETSDI
jgi:hypothetical protein